MLFVFFFATIFSKLNCNQDAVIRRLEPYMQNMGQLERHSVTPTALLMDHDAGIKRFLETILNSRGFLVYSFATAAEAQTAVIGLAGELSLVICDVDLRDHKSMDFPQAIAVSYPALPVVLTSAWGELPESADRFPYLLKPFGLKALFATLSELTEVSYRSGRAA